MTFNSQVKAVSYPTATMAVITGGQSGTAPICTSDPTTLVMAPAKVTVQVSSVTQTSHRGKSNGDDRCSRLGILNARPLRTSRSPPRLSPAVSPVQLPRWPRPRAPQALRFDADSGSTRYTKHLELYNPCKGSLRGTSIMDVVASHACIGDIESGGISPVPLTAIPGPGQLPPICRTDRRNPKCVALG